MSKKPSVQQNTFRGFVNYELTAEERTKLKAEPFSFEHAEDTLVKLLEGGYKVTLSFDDFSKSPCAWIIPKDPKNENFGLILSGRGSTPLKALKQAAYKHFVVFDGVWGEHYKDFSKELDD